MRFYLSRILACLLILLLLLENIHAQKGFNPVQFSYSIRWQALQKHIVELSSPAYQGRMAGSLYEKKAASYIESEFRNAGLLPSKSLEIKGSGKQNFWYLGRSVQSMCITDGKDSLWWGRDFYVWPYDEIHDTFMICHAGLGVDQNGFSDFSGRNWKHCLGAVVPAMTKELIPETFWKTPYVSDVDSLMARMEKYQARGIIIPLPDNYFPFVIYTDLYQKIKNSWELPGIHPGLKDPFIYMLTSRKAFLKISEKSSFQFKSDLENHYRDPKKEDNFAQSSIWIQSAVYQTDTIRSVNIIGMIPGQQLAQEAVVLSAHFDHLGEKENGYFPGADDNASGVAALMEIAKAFQKAVSKGFTPQRTILFVAFSSEERGLLGSAWYVNHQPIPAILNINLDMIGRSDTLHKNNPDYTYFLSGEKQKEKFLQDIIQTAGVYCPGLSIDNSLNENDFIGFFKRSDQYSFHLENIPVIFLTTGEHPDYHTENDKAELIQSVKLEMISRLAFGLAWKYAIDPTLPGIVP